MLSGRSTRRYRRSVWSVSRPVRPNTAAIPCAARSASRQPARPRPLKASGREPTAIRRWWMAVPTPDSPLSSFGSATTDLCRRLWALSRGDAAALRQPGRHRRRTDSPGLDHHVGFAAGDAAAEQQLVRTVHAASNVQPVAGRRLVDEPNDSGPGLQFDNVEASSSPDATATVAGAAGGRTFTSGALAATVQGWVNGETNNGWALWVNQSSSFQVATSEDGNPSSRPMLTVTYRAPVQTTSLTGAGVTVAVIDSGILLDSPDASRLKTTRDFTTGLANPPAVAPWTRTVTARTWRPDGQRPGRTARRGARRVVRQPARARRAGAGTTSHVINALQWAVAHRGAYGIDVINLSLGHPIYEPAATDPLVQAVEAAVRAGIVVVSRPATSARTRHRPGRLRRHHVARQRAVGASRSARPRRSTRRRRTDDLVADYSSRGPTWYDGSRSRTSWRPATDLCRSRHVADALSRPTRRCAVQRRQPDAT